jgi:hypothetical protein
MTACPDGCYRPGKCKEITIVKNFVKPDPKNPDKVSLEFNRDLGDIKYNIQVVDPSDEAAAHAGTLPVMSKEE